MEASHHLSRQGEETREARYINYECTMQTFRPCQHYPVRWLDVEADFELVRAFWSPPLSL